MFKKNEKNEREMKDSIRLYKFGFISLIISIWIILILPQLQIGMTIKDVSITNEVKQIALDIERECSKNVSNLKVQPFERRESYEKCLQNKVAEFTLLKTPYKSDNLIENALFLNNDINYTLNNGGDCENQAILASSLLKYMDLGVIYIVIQEGHACWMIQNENGFELYNCYPDLEILNIKSI